MAWNYSSEPSPPGFQSVVRVCTPRSSMPPRPGPAISSPRVHEPLVSWFLVVVDEVLDATILHVLDRRLLGHTRDDVEEVLELSEHNLVNETFGLFM